MQGVAIWSSLPPVVVSYLNKMIWVISNSGCILLGSHRHTPWERVWKQVLIIHWEVISGNTGGGMATRDKDGRERQLRKWWDVNPAATVSSCHCILLQNPGNQCREHAPELPTGWVRELVMNCCGSATVQAASANLVMEISQAYTTESGVWMEALTMAATNTTQYFHQLYVLYALKDLDNWHQLIWEKLKSEII